MKRYLIFAAAAACWGVASADVRAGFATGDIYASFNIGSDQNSVAHYDSTGAYIGSMAVPSSSSGDWSTRGLAIGPDGLLYVVQDRTDFSLPDPLSKQFSVLAYDSSGTLQHTYNYDGPGSYIGGNISYGKIGFDASGHFFVGALGGLVEFTEGSANSGNLLFPTTGNGAFDVKALTNGHLLVASAYDIYEIDGSGNVLRDLKQAGSGANAVDFVDLRGIEFDAGAGVLYASMLGYTGHSDQVLKIDYATGALLGTATFKYADDLSLGSDGRLLVGSREQTPIFLDKDLNALGSFSSIPGPRDFVTQVGGSDPAAVPEPASLALLGVGVATLLAAARRRPR